MRAAMMLLLTIALPCAAQAQDVSNRQNVALPDKKDRGPQPTPPVLVVEPVAMMMATFDSDGDGRVTRDEMRRGVQHSFEVIDTAKSGKLGYILFSDWASKWLGDPNALPSAYETDADSDNQITLTELQAKFDQIFARLDKDKDGVLSRAELLTIRANPGGYGDRRGRKNGAP